MNEWDRTAKRKASPARRRASLESRVVSPRLRCDTKAPRLTPLVRLEPRQPVAYPDAGQSRRPAGLASAREWWGGRVPGLGSVEPRIALGWIGSRDWAVVGLGCVLSRGPGELDSLSLGLSLAYCVVSGLWFREER